MDTNFNYCGGWIITIQNYAKEGEYRYNVSNTETGGTWRSNSQEEFVNFVNEILKEVG